MPLDKSHLAEQALAPACRLADAFDAELLLLHVLEPPVYALKEKAPNLFPFDPQADLAEAQDYLEALANNLRATGKMVEVAIGTGFQASTIATFADENNADVIAMATHGRGGLTRLLAGSVATAVLTRTKVPLLLLRPAA